MFSHVFVGTSDFTRAMDFYESVMVELGLALKFCDRTGELAGWMTPGEPRPLFLLGRPHDRQAAAPGNGPMTAFLAKERAMVDRVYLRALSKGGRDEGRPGLRPQYHPDYYGAYVRDLDANKICFCCHEAVPDGAA